MLFTVPETLLIALLSAFLGGIVSHWLSLGRDRRKEWNEVCGPIYDHFFEMSITGNFSARLSTAAIGPLEAQLSARQSRQLRKAIADIYASLPVMGPYDPQIGGSNELIKAGDTMLRERALARALLITKRRR